MRKLVLFDLDGTLTESAPGIVNSIQYALRSMGVEGYADEELEAFVGPPLLGSFMNVVGLSEEESLEAIKLFRERFSTIGKFENNLYPGVEEMLQTLREAGIPLGVASSKPEIFVREIVEHFGIAEYFDVIAGAPADERNNSKPEVIRDALSRYEMEEWTDRVLMVGDTVYDIKGAKELGIPAIGVTYGYGRPREMEEAGAIALVSSVLKLTEYLLEQA